MCRWDITTINTAVTGYVVSSWAGHAPPTELLFDLTYEIYFRFRVFSSRWKIALRLYLLVTSSVSIYENNPPVAVFVRLFPLFWTSDDNTNPWIIKPAATFICTYFVFCTYSKNSRFFWKFVFYFIDYLITLASVQHHLFGVIGRFRDYLFSIVVIYVLK